jgi:hypothetical protein
MYLYTIHTAASIGAMVQRCNRNNAGPGYLGRIGLVNQALLESEPVTAQSFYRTWTV